MDVRQSVFGNKPFSVAYNLTGHSERGTGVFSNANDGCIGEPLCLRCKSHLSFSCYGRSKCLCTGFSNQKSQLTRRT